MFKLRLTFDKPTVGYWDGGEKSGGDFTLEGCPREHPGKNNTLRWGCFYLNF